jgi:hypothetical protein
MKLFLVGVSWLLSMSVMKADEIRLASGPEKTSLLELYTSEGCSSCPPAEAQLGRLKDAPGLWKQFVPVAYHVDYWDRLGWRDRLSSPAWTARQQRYASLWRSDSVYTPAFVLDGKETHGGEGELSSPKGVSGVLSATAKNGRTWQIVFQPAEKSATEWEVHLAQLGVGISSRIGGGENDGRTLTHDFVVLAQQDAPLKTEGDHASTRLTAIPSQETAPRRAVAIWVTRRGELAPVQATGGWISSK